MITAKKQLNLLIAILLLTLSSSYAFTDEKGKPPMFTESGHTVDDLELIRTRVVKGEAVLLDVREQDEWDAGHLAAASFMPLSELRDGKIPEKYSKLLPKDKPIYLHCRSGGRVLMCAEILMNQKLEIRPMKAGYEKLLQAGYQKAE
ncbi:MAG: rhodanese-like domain-containing protein [Phycisphaerae bacterium]